MNYSHFNFLTQEVSQQQKSVYLSNVQLVRNFMDNAENLSFEQVEWLKTVMSELMGWIPMNVEKVSGFSKSFERLVINEDICGENRRLKNLSEVRYPPLSISHKLPYNRASLKGKSVMYAGSMGPLPVAVETKPKLGQLTTTSFWKMKKGKTLNLLTVFHDPMIAISNRKLDDWNDYNRDLQKMKPNSREVVEAFYDLVVDAFTRKVSPNNRQGYLISALFAELFYNHPIAPVDAIYYPSVPNNSSVMNIAILPNTVDNVFELDRIEEHLVTNDPRSGSGGWFSAGTAVSKVYDPNSLALEWINKPLIEGNIESIIQEFKVRFD